MCQVMSDPEPVFHLRKTDPAVKVDLRARHPFRPSASSVGPSVRVVLRALEVAHAALGEEERGLFRPMSRCQ